MQSMVIISDGSNPDFLNRIELESNFKLFFELKLNRTFIFSTEPTYYDFKLNLNSNSILFIIYIVPTYKLNQP
jgi:hypothetical protein